MLEWPKEDKIECSVSTCYASVHFSAPVNHKICSANTQMHVCPVHKTSVEQNEINITVKILNSLKVMARDREKILSYPV